MGPIAVCRRLSNDNSVLLQKKPTGGSLSFVLAIRDCLFWLVTCAKRCFSLNPISDFDKVLQRQN